MFIARIRENLISSDIEKEYAVFQNAGAVVQFHGRIRQINNGKEVRHIDFETYHSMALKEMKKILREVKERWPLLGAVISHREGRVFPGEIAVKILSFSEHRKEAYAANQFMIDQIKKTVPIWKKEAYRDGELWVAAHP